MNNAYMLFQGKVSDTHLMVIKSELDKAEAATWNTQNNPLHCADVFCRASGTKGR